MRVAIACPADCLGHGTCANGQCYCEPGWTGDACETPTVIVSTGCGITVWTASLAQLPAITMGLLVGWGIKHSIEQRQRAKMRAILQQDAQRPFSSGAAAATY